MPLLHFVAPLMPPDFQITDVDHSTKSYFNTVTLEWGPPNGTGTQNIVETYGFIVIPKSIFLITNRTVSSPYSIYLAYNIRYSVQIFAVNCAGISEPATISDIYHGK